MLNAAARQTITGSIVKVYIHTCILDTCTYTCDIALAKPSGHRQYHPRYACIHTYVYTCTYMCEIPLQRQIIIGGIVKVYTRTHIMYTCTYTCAVPLAKQSGHRRHRQSNPTLQNTAQSTRKLPAAHNHPRTRAHTHAHHNVCQEIFDTILNQAKKKEICDTILPSFDAILYYRQYLVSRYKFVSRNLCIADKIVLWFVQNTIRHLDKDADTRANKHTDADTDAHTATATNKATAAFTEFFRENTLACRHTYTNNMHE